MQLIRKIDINFFFFFFTASLESARRHATNGNYNTTDEEQLGRGKRPHLKNTRYDSSEEEECEEDEPVEKKSRTKSTSHL